jgi:hypothetical protein
MPFESPCCARGEMRACQIDGDHVVVNGVWGLVVVAQELKWEQGFDPVASIRREWRKEEEIVGQEPCLLSLLVSVSCTGVDRERALGSTHLKQASSKKLLSVAERGNRLERPLRPLRLVLAPRWW